MFFSIGKEYSKLPERFDFNGVKLHTDAGWSQAQVNGKTVFYKGYCLDYPIAEISAILKHEGHLDGIFCIIIFDHETNTVSFKHGDMRGYPIHYIEDQIHNIPFEAGDLLPIEKHIVMQNGVTSVLYNSTELYKYPVEGIISLDTASELIGNILEDNIKRFLKHNPVNLHCAFSGGIDTLTCWAILSTLTDEYTTNVDAILNNNELRPTNTYPFFDELTAIEWGYFETGVYSDAKYIITGFWGDEIMLRNPVQFNYLANIQGKTAAHIVAENPDTYMTKYFLKGKNTKKINKLEEISFDKFTHIAFSSVAYDFQIWHIDENIHFSPFYDKRIIDVLLHLNEADLIENSLHVTIQKNIIKRFNPIMLSYLDDFKNDMTVNFVNLKKNYQK